MERTEAKSSVTCTAINFLQFIYNKGCISIKKKVSIKNNIVPKEKIKASKV